MGWANQARCLQCGVRLPLLRKLTDGDFCSAAHRKVFQEDQSRLAVERLMESHKQCNRVTTEVRSNIEREQLVLQGPPMAPAVKMFVAHSSEPSWGMLALDPLAYDFPSTPSIPHTDCTQQDRILPRAPSASISSLMKAAPCQRQELPDPIQGRWDAGVSLTPPGSGLAPEFESRATEVPGIAEMGAIQALPMISARQNHAAPAVTIEPIAARTRTWLPLPALDPLESPFGTDYEPPMADTLALAMPGAIAPRNGSLADAGNPLQSTTGRVAVPLRPNPRISGIADFTEVGTFSEPPAAAIQKLSMPDSIAPHNALSLAEAGKPVLPTSGYVAVPVHPDPRIAGIEARSERCLPLAPPNPVGADSVSRLSEPQPSMVLKPWHVLPASIPYKKAIARIRANARLVRLQPRGPIEPPTTWGSQPPEAKAFAQPALGQPVFARPAADPLELALANSLPLEPRGAIEPPHTWGLKAIGECAFSTLGVRRPAYFPEANTPCFARREKVPVPLSTGVNSPPDRSLMLRSMAPPEQGVSKPVCPPSRLTPLHVVRGVTPAHVAAAVAQASRSPQQRVQAFLRTRGLQMVLMLAPVMILFTFWPGEQPTHAAAPANGSPVSQYVNARLTDIKTAIQSRAGIEMLDDFRTGLDNWEGRGSLSRSWSYDQTGFVKPGPLALYKPSLGLSEYSFEFLGQIDRRALGWVYRAQDMHNYHVAKLVMLRPGPLPTIGLIRYSVINGRETKHIETVLPLNVHSDTVYRVRLEARGNDFSLYVQDQMVQFWSDWRLPTGGVGFFSGHGEQSRIRWMQISHQYDAIGKLCAYFAPMAVVTYNLQSTMGAESK